MKSVSGRETGQRQRTGMAGLSWVIAATAVVIALRLAASLSLSGHPLLLHPVLEDADYQARSLAVHQGEWLDRELPRGSVLYPLLVGALPKLAEDPRALAIAQSLLEGITALLLMLLVRRRWGTAAAALAGILYALDPLGAFFAARYSPVIPATLCFVASVSVLLWEEERARANRPAGAGSLLLFGVLLAVGFLLQPLPFLILLLIRAYLLRKPKEGARAGRSLARALWPVAPVVLLAAAVLAQHATLEDGGPVLGWGGGVALRNAYDPATGGTPRGLAPPSWASDSSIRAQVWEALGHEGTDLDVFRYYASGGAREILENPMGTIGVLLTKGLGLAGSFPIPDSISAPFLTRERGRLFAYLRYSFALLLALGAAGIARKRGDPLHRALVIGLISVAGASLLGQSSAASRQAALPLLAALGAAWIAELAGRKGSLRPAVVAIAGGALAISLLAGFFAPTARLRNPSEDLRLLATTFARTQATRQAVPLLEEAVRADPKNLEARVSLAQVYQQDGLVQAATEQLEAAYQADSTHAGTLFALATIDQSRGETAKALTLMSRLVAQHPGNPLYLNEMGQMLILTGQVGEAQRYLQRAVRLKPDYAVAQKNLQVVETYRQRMEQSFLPPEMRLAEDDPLQRSFLGITDSLDQSRWTGADSLINRVQRERPDLVQPHWFRSAYHARRGEFPEAVRELELCTRMAPGRPLIVQQLVRLYQQTGETGKVEPLLRASLAAAGDDTVRVHAFQAMEEQWRSARAGGGR